MRSRAFADGGCYVMRSVASRVFVDCGPVGLAGRGGHGHNDCLSFTADLAGVPVVSDCGSYLYTASYAERNAFRSTAYHNTLQVGDEELNRFISPLHLWTLHDDATPGLRLWHSDDEVDVFVGAHGGYRRLTPPGVPVRTILFDKRHELLAIRDELQGDAARDVTVPLHFAPGVELRERGAARVVASADVPRPLASCAGSRAPPSSRRASRRATGAWSARSAWRGGARRRLRRRSMC